MRTIAAIVIAAALAAGAIAAPADAAVKWPRSCTSCHCEDQVI